ncbi:hypothetical protein SOVF_200210, partial [Spinacia oleracea]
MKDGVYAVVLTTLPED